MRLVQFRVGDAVRLGVVEADRVIDVKETAAAKGRRDHAFDSVCDLLNAGDDALNFVRSLRPDDSSPRLADVKLTAPVSARKIVAVGLNYADHAREAGMSLPVAPLCFAKFTSSLTGPYDPILLPAEDAQVDYEAELGVVIAREAKRIAEAEAMRYVAGYLVFNDVSARKWQFGDNQWTRGKSCDSFAPCGPWLITADEVPDPGSLRIRTRVNGETLQDSNTSQLIFNVAQLVSYFSHSFTLEPGDIIATGTPPGVGIGRKPPRFLQDGDIVEVEIENVGMIRNRVVRDYPRSTDQ